MINMLRRSIGEIVRVLQERGENVSRLGIAGVDEVESAIQEDDATPLWSSIDTLDLVTRLDSFSSTLGVSEETTKQEQEAADNGDTRRMDNRIIIRRTFEARDEAHMRYEQALITFFDSNPEAYQYLIYCPHINRDITDDMGHYGYVEGYIYVTGRLRYDEVRTMADKYVDENLLGANPLIGENDLLQIGHYDAFPKNKFEHHVFRNMGGAYPRLFSHLHEHIKSRGASFSSKDVIDTLESGVSEKD